MEVNGLETLLVDRGNFFHGTFEFVEHGKFFVIIGINEDDEIGYFLINTNVNERVIRTHEERALQISISPSEYQFLDHISFINCARMLTMSKATLITLLQSAKVQYKDTLRDAHLADILQRLNASPLYSVREKQEFFS